MKTVNFKWLAVPVAALAMSATVLSCGGDDPTPDPTPNPEQPEPVKPGATLGSEEQKERLGDIGKQVINLIPASDFEEVLELGRYIADNYFDTDGDELEQWVEDCLDAIGGEVVRTEKDYWGDVYTYTRRTYSASQFRAHVEWRNGDWRITQRNTSDLQFSCPTKNGQQCVATLKTSGKTTKVYAGEIYRDDNESYVNGSWLYEEEIDLAYMEVPEQIDITVTRGNQTLLTTTIKTDLSSMTGTDFNLSRDRYGVEVNASCCGYDFKSVRAAAKANTRNGATASFAIEKGGKTLISASVTGEVDVKGGYLSEFDETEPEVNGGNITQLALDLLGQLQVKGTCSNIKAMTEALESAQDSRNLQEALGYVAEANRLLTAELFYDGTSTRQAYLEMDVFEERDYYYGNEYVLRPLICFPDGSSYSIADESYFNETNFQSLINLFENLQKDYERLADRYLD